MVYFTLTYIHSFRNPRSCLIAQRRISIYVLLLGKRVQGSSCISPSRLSSAACQQCRHDVRLCGVDGAPSGALSHSFSRTPWHFPPLSQQCRHSGNGPADVWWLLGSKNCSCGIFGRVPTSPIDWLWPIIWNHFPITEFLVSSGSKSKCFHSFNLLQLCLEIEISRHQWQKQMIQCHVLTTACSPCSCFGHMPMCLPGSDGAHGALDQGGGPSCPVTVLYHAVSFQDWHPHANFIHFKDCAKHWVNKTISLPSKYLLPRGRNPATESS